MNINKKFIKENIVRLPLQQQQSLIDTFADKLQACNSVEAKKNSLILKIDKLTEELDTLLVRFIKNYYESLKIGVHHSELIN